VKGKKMFDESDEDAISHGWESAEEHQEALDDFADEMFGGGVDLGDDDIDEDDIDEDGI
jgi:hypothetical protein